MSEPLSAAETRRLLTQLGRGWALEEVDGVPRLWRGFRTADFVSAVRFVDALTPVVEDAGHHPDLEVGWGRVRVTLTTHDAGGLTEPDFLVAAAIHRVADEVGLGS